MLILFSAPPKDDPCFPSPCGPNTHCNNGVCSCIAEYNGDPYRGCRPECVLNSDCPRNRACVQQKCVDPCPGSCGQQAICEVMNHVPMCSCPPPLEGNAFVQCRPAERDPPKLTNPCHPNPCGSNSQCRVQNSVAICSCIPGYFGAPPVCRPECVQNSDCLSYLTCVNQKCVDPCPGLCAFNAICRVTNNAARCQCPPGHTGDPFVRCNRIGKCWHTHFKQQFH